jgi:hypothetical protein
MTTARSLIAAAVALAAITATSACTANDPKPTPSTTTAITSTTTAPTPSSTSLSPAEQDAKDAAQTITRFWGVLDALASDQKKSLDGLATVSRDQAIAQWRSNLTSYRRSGWKQVGDSTVLSADAQAIGDKSNFTVTACIDVSKANVVDAAGKSVIAAGRQDRMRYTYKVQKASGGFFVTEDLLKGRPC